MRGEVKVGATTASRYNDISATGRMKAHPSLLLDLALPVVSSCSYDLPPSPSHTFPCFSFPAEVASLWVKSSICSSEMDGASCGLVFGELSGLG